MRSESEHGVQISHDIDIVSSPPMVCSAKSVMGHSDISVTMNTYTHLGLEDAAAEMKRLEEVERARGEQERMDDPFSEGEDDHGMAM